MHVTNTFLKSFIIFALCVMGLTGATARSQAQTPTSITIEFQPHQSGYPRGTQVKLVAHLQDCYGHPVANMSVSFHVWVQSNGLQQQVGAGVTDANGNAACYYTVPGPNNNNVYLLSQFGALQSGWLRLPIG